MPGHERFVRNMLAGAGGIDLALLVVAADDGVMPQTREHLAICSLLGIKAGLVALTKADLVEPDWLELVRDDVAGAVARHVPRGRADRAGLGEDGRGARRAPRRAPDARRVGAARGSPTELPRLPIDRVFTVRGFGTVVTGTLTAGALAADDRVEVYPRGAEAKIRGLQTHGHPVAAARAGQRTAVNLQGLERAAIDARRRRRPARARSFRRPSSTVRSSFSRGRAAPGEDARLACASTSERARSWRASSSLDRAELAPGDTAFARFRLEAPLVARPGDRFVVRSYSPVVTIGGGTLLDVDPPRFKRKAPGPGRASLGAADGEPGGRARRSTSVTSARPACA